ASPSMRTSSSVSYTGPGTSMTYGDGANPSSSTPTRPSTRSEEPSEPRRRGRECRNGSSPNRTIGIPSSSHPDQQHSLTMTEPGMFGAGALAIHPPKSKPSLPRHARDTVRDMPDIPEQDPEDEFRDMLREFL